MAPYTRCVTPSMPVPLGRPSLPLRARPFHLEGVPNALRVGCSWHVLSSASLVWGVPASPRLDGDLCRLTAPFSRNSKHAVRSLPAPAAPDEKFASLKLMFSGDKTAFLSSTFEIFSVCSFQGDV